MSKSKAKSKKAAQKKKAAKAQKQKQRNTGRLLGALFIILGLGTAGYFAWPYMQSVPEVSRPIDEASLDPAVTALITPMIGAIEENPRDASLRANLAMAYEANTLWPEARQSYENALALEDEEMAWHLHYAMATREAGDVEGARTLLEEAAQAFPGSGSILHRLAEARTEVGELDGAEAAYRQLIQVSPRLAQGYVGLADVLLQKGQVDAAIQYVTKGLEYQSDYRLGYYVLGQAYLQTDQPELAGDYLAVGVNAAVQYVPDPLTNKITGYIVNATGRLALAQALLDSGQAQEASQLLAETYRYHPSNIMLINTLAVSYMRTERLDQAELLLQRAISVEDRHFYTYLNLYNWALRSDKKEKALVYADSAIARGPERDDTHLARAQALKELGRLDEASVSVEKARELGSQNAANFGLSGEIALEMERYEEAITFFVTATELNPGLILAWTGLARAHRGAGNIREARGVLQQLRSTASRHPAVIQLEREFSSMGQ